MRIDWIYVNEVYISENYYNFIE